MNVIARTTATKRVPMDSLRKTALVAGILYLATFVSIPILALYTPVLNDPNWVTGPGPDTPILIGGVLEVIVALAGIGTAVALYPVVKRQNGGVALGFVGTRVLEAAALFAGVVALLSVVTLRQSGAGADAVVTGQALVAQYGWSFLLGGSLMPAMNALLLGSLLYRLRPGATNPPHLGINRSSPTARLRLRRAVRRVGPGVPAVRACRNSDRSLGVLTRRVPDRQRLQAFPDHRRYDHCRCGACPPERHRLTLDESGRA